MFTDSAGTVGLLIKHTFSVNHVACTKCVCKPAQLVCSKLCMQCCGNQIFVIAYPLPMACDRAGAVSEAPLQPRLM